MRECLSIILTLLIVENVKGNTNDCVTVRTEVGDICGESASDGSYIMYLGIPYAKVDENNPFGPSKPHPKFDTLFQANDDTFRCPQIDEFSREAVGSLDCLRLNIYVPHSELANARFPVMVYIHGGGFSGGYASKSIYGPKYLTRHGVILVTLNYRLGPYGFMCLHTPAVPGNQGLKDQLIALRWIRDNIHDFGGDVENITLFGSSAGARSVDLHLLSPHEKLFHRAILQSGSVLNPGWFPEPDIEVPIKLAETLGFVTTDGEEALSFISKADTHRIIAASTTRSDISFRLCVEKDHKDIDKFITDIPLSLNVTKAIDMTLLFGYNSQEMLSIYVNQRPEYFENLNVFYDKLKTAFTVDSNTLNDLEKIVRNFYIGDEKMSDNVKLELADFDSDITYIHATVRNINRYLNNGASNVYYYIFSYNGGRNFMKSRRNITIGGANHADEKGYLFDLEIIFSGENTVEDQKVIDAMTTMWTNFAKYGDPTPVTTELLPVKWESITKESVYHYLDIDLELTTGVRPFHERLTFWDLLYEYYENVQK